MRIVQAGIVKIVHWERMYNRRCEMVISICRTSRCRWGVFKHLLIGGWYIRLGKLVLSVSKVG